MPSWLSSPGPILLRKFVRNSKSDPLVGPVNLVSATPYYAHIRHPDGRESTVSTRDLAPSPGDRVPSAESAPVTPSRNTSETLPYRGRLPQGLPQGLSNILF